MNRFCLLLTSFAVMSAGSVSVALAEDAPVKVTVIEDAAPVNPPSATIAAKPASCDFSKVPDAKQGEIIIRKIADEEAFDLDFLLAIARQESGFRMNAVSSAGAVGLMQLMPATAKRFSVDICDPEDNVRGAVRYLRFLQKRYQNPLYVLAAYNAGEGAVDQNRGIPLYPETVRYVSAILTDLYGWKPLGVPASDGEKRTAGKKNEGQPAKPEEWTQGFVLHVE